MPRPSCLCRTGVWKWGEGSGLFNYSIGFGLGSGFGLEWRLRKFGTDSETRSYEVEKEDIDER